MQSNLLLGAGVGVGVGVGVVMGGPMRKNARQSTIQLKTGTREKRTLWKKLLPGPSTGITTSKLI